MLNIYYVIMKNKSILDTFVIHANIHNILIILTILSYFRFITYGLFFVGFIHFLLFVNQRNIYPSPIRTILKSWNSQVSWNKSFIPNILIFLPKSLYFNRFVLNDKQLGENRNLKIISALIEKSTAISSDKNQFIRNTSFVTKSDQWWRLNICISAPK